MTAPSRFWLVRKPSSTGTIVARFDTPAPDATPIEAIEAADSLTVQSVAGRSALADASVDPSVLTEAERQAIGIIG